MLAQFQPKPRECKQCGSMFTPHRPLAYICSPACANRYVKANKVAERKQTKVRKDALKTIPELIKEAQHAFNAWTRERDRQAGYACISSGRPLDWTGNAVDAGHYRSTGAAPHLRFDERNCHAQSKHDNQYLAGNAVDYRIGLVNRIGLDALEALEADNEVRKWNRDELIAIKATYKAKLKALKAREVA